MHFQEAVNEITVHQFFKKRDAHFWQLHLQTWNGKPISGLMITEGNLESGRRRGAPAVLSHTRLNFFVPELQVRDLDELNGKLAEMCRRDLQRHLLGKTGSKAERLREDQLAF